MVPRKVGSAWEVDAPAKLNLYLEVLGKRTDGFHDLETLLVPVRIFDRLQWTPGHTTSPPAPAERQLCLQVDHQTLPARSRALCNSGDGNLVLRAAKLLAQKAGVEPWGVFRLSKRIPIQAGMGGGSSDAAAALLLANKAWNIGYSQEQLMELAVEVGSDVPFFLSGGPAVCRGRGELITPVAGLPKFHFVIVKPSVGLSTAEVFRQFSFGTGKQSATQTATQDRGETILNMLRKGAVAQAGKEMRNTLESVAERLAPILRQIKRSLTESGCSISLMTGSGSAYLGIARTAWHARRTAHALASQNLGTVLATSSCW